MQAPFTRPPDQLGIVVPDLEAEIKRWLERGVGPFYTIGGAMLSHYVYRGERSSPRVSAAFGQAGPLQLELIQPDDDERSAYREFVDAGGNGLHHFGWFSDDLDRDRTTAEGGTGLSLVQTGQVLGTPFAYYEPSEPWPAAGLLDTLTAEGPQAQEALSEARGWDGRLLEVLAPNSMSRKTFAEVRQAAAEWDGRTEPVRHLLGHMMEGAFELQTLAQRVGRWFSERA
ncbi:MAG: VOC family protein [Chloroflexota bacterium]